MSKYDNRSLDKKHVKWAKRIKARDNYTCQICGKSGVWLNSHHLNSYAYFPEERYLDANGITLCSNGPFSCHENFHRIYGKERTTRYQFEEFRKSCELIKKAVETLDGYK